MKGILINKFRGDIRLFANGKKTLEALCGIPVVGIVPYYKDIYIEDEDSVRLANKHSQALRGKVNIAVVLLRHISNFTDFDALERDPRVHLFYTVHEDELLKADIILIPGTKNTISDLAGLRDNGAAQAIIRARHEHGVTVMGICGGYQMMGREVCDPHHLEGDTERLPGLGLLPVFTQIEEEKVTRRVRFHFKGSRALCRGYEIHMGKTGVDGQRRSPFAQIGQERRAEGYYADRRCFGTCIHGVFDNPAFVDFLLEPFAGKVAARSVDYKTFREEQYDKLAALVRRHVDMPLIYQIMAEPAAGHSS